MPETVVAEVHQPPSEPLSPASSNGQFFAAEGMALLAMDRPVEALVALCSAVSLGDSAPSTLLNLALAEERTGDLQRARRLMHSLQERLPQWDEPSLRLAENLRRDGCNAGAEAAYRQVLAINPRRKEALLALSGLLLARGEAVEARELLLRCCGVAPDCPEAWHVLGLALMFTGDAGLAHTAFIEAQRLEPAVPDHALRGIEAAFAAGAAEPELLRLEGESGADPLNPCWLLARGMLLDRVGRPAEAIDILQAAAELAPDSGLAAGLLGGVLARSHRAADAEAALGRAIELDPENPLLRNDRAAVLMRLHRHPEARALLLDVVERYGEQMPVLCNLANATACIGLQAEAVAIARRAIALDQDAVLPRRTLCNTLPYQDGTTGADLLLAARACAKRLPHGPMPEFSNTRDPDRPLVIGLLSGTLRTHPVGWLTVAGFETLNPVDFTLVCMVQNAVPADPMARRYRAIAREWIGTDALDDLTLAATARERGVDVLIDLGGYGDAGRMPACAHRLAPVQIKWVGMQTHSTGLAEMDWMLTDRWETPPDLAHLYSERALRMPDGYVCYSPPPYAPDVSPLPALFNGHVTFGCFNNLAKVTPRAIATWAEVLRQVPDSRMVLKTHQFSDPPTGDRIRAAMAALGVDPRRIETRGSSRHRAFLGEYNDIDIVLDPFPYSGGLTTCEALWMGVPTLTLPGEFFASRHSLSHLCNAGLTDWVASTPDDYIALAVAKAADLTALAALRAGLRAQVRASPLCDARRFGRNLGSALRHAWRAWCLS